MSYREPDTGQYLATIRICAEAIQGGYASSATVNSLAMEITRLVDELTDAYEKRRLDAR